MCRTTRVKRKVPLGSQGISYILVRCTVAPEAQQACQAIEARRACTAAASFCSMLCLSFSSVMASMLALSRGASGIAVVETESNAPIDVRRSGIAVVDAESNEPIADARRSPVPRFLRFSMMRRCASASSFAFTGSCAANRATMSFVTLDAPFALCSAAAGGSGLGSEAEERIFGVDAGRVEPLSAKPTHHIVMANIVMA